jgi:hypothetical protein
MGLWVALLLGCLAAPPTVYRTGLEQVARAYVPLHASDWIDWGRVCLAPQGQDVNGWCLEAPLHKGTVGDGRRRLCLDDGH